MVRTGYESDLITVLHHGAAALPEDLGQLRGYLRLISGLLAEKAQENQQTLALENAAAEEISLLLDLEALVAAKAAEVSCKGYSCIQAKLDIWDAIEPPDPEPCPRDTIVQSVRGDVARLAARRERRLVSGGLY